MKIKKLLALSALALGAIGVASCGKEEPKQEPNQEENQGGNTGGEQNQGGNTGGSTGGSTGGDQGGTTGGDQGGTTGGSTGGDQGGSTGGNTGEENPVVKTKINFVTGIADLQIEAKEAESLSNLPIPSYEGKLFSGWYQDEALTTQIKDGTAIKADTTIYAKWTDSVVDKEATEAKEITSLEEFLAFRKLGEAATGNYKLMCDIDLGGIELETPTTLLSGVFDGNGHVIKNAKYVNAASKSGVLVKILQNGGVIKNVKFLSCHVTSTSESPAIVCGEVNGGGMIKDVEINACSVETTGNYGAIIYARSENSANAEVVLDGITVKNNSTVKCAQYGGFITGDNTANVTLRNAKVEGRFSGSSNNYGVLLGRTRNDAQIYRLENVITSVSCDAAGSSTGLVSQGKNMVNTIVKNVLVNVADKTLAGAKGILFAENVYYTTNSNVPAHSGVKEIAPSLVNADWYKNTLLDNFDLLWDVEANGEIKLKSSSPNVVDENDVLSGITISSAGAKVRFKKGEDLTASGLLVSAVYESGVQITLNEGDFTVDSSAFNKDSAGKYTINVSYTVKGVTKTANYEVEVVEQTGFTIDTQFVKKLYTTGAAIETSNLVCYGTWSDGLTQKLDTSEFSVDVSLFNSQAAGKYVITVTSGSFAPQQFEVTVVSGAQEVVDNKVTVNVDAAVLDDGEVVNGTYTFKTVQSAIDYLAQNNYEDTVRKIISIKDGVYREKITLSINNVTFLGESREGTKIVYDAVESTVDPLTGKQYVLNCATVHVNAQGFEARNISIINDFDYVNNQYNPDYVNVKESSPQGLALTLNGDRFILENVHLYGNQDTLYLKAGRTLIQGGIVEGNIDFIFGEASGIAYFNEVNINSIPRGMTAEQMKNNGYVTAMKGADGSKPNYGVVFNNCSFTADPTVPAGSMSLGRPWGKRATVAYIGCNFSEAYSTLAYDGKTKSRWFDMSGNAPQDADFCEYGSTGPGAISQAVAGGNYLTAEQAANYTMTNTFAKVNGDIIWATEWDPTSDVIPVDHNTYYYFNGTTGTGNAYTFNQTVQASSYDWVEAGMTVDATAGKVQARTADTQITAGAKLVFEVQAGSTVTVTNHPGYHDYTLNGVATVSDTFMQYYAETTTVTLEAYNTCYIWSIVVSPNQEAPAAASVKQLELKGAPNTQLSVGTELDLSTLSVKAIYTDNSVKTLASTDYTVDTTKVNNTLAGTYEVTVSYEGASQVFSVEYIEGAVSTVVDSNTALSFKGSSFATVADTAAVMEGNIDASTTPYTTNKITFTNCKANGADNWLKFNTGAIISFETADATTLTIAQYGSTTAVKVTLNGVEVQPSATPVVNGDNILITYNLSAAGNVEITPVSNTYLGAIAVTGF